MTPGKKIIMASAKNPTDNSKPVKLALSLIKADKVHLQPRVEMDDDHMQRMARGYIDGEDIPPPVHVFYDGKFYWLVDGFHRYFAMWSIRHMRAKFQHIRAIVHEGTKEEAIVYAAMANLDNRSKEMTDPDRKKAMWMLMDLPEWQVKSPSVIGKDFDLASGTAKRWWLEYFENHNLEVPNYALRSDGRKSPTSINTRKNKRNPRLMRNGPDRSKFSASIAGNTIYLGKDEKDATKKLDEILDAREATCRFYEMSSNIGSRLTSCNLTYSSIFGNKTMNFPWCHGYLVQGVAVVWESFRDTNGAIMAWGKARAACQMSGVSRVVVLCPVEQGPADLLNLARQDGVEWMTIDDFVASLQPSDTTPDEAKADE